MPTANTSRTWIEEDLGYRTACWIWQGYRNAGGYGLTSVDRRRTMAYRFTWEQANGPVPDGLELDHLCRNPGCVNPAHLEAVTHAENIRRSVRARVTWETVRDIRASTESASQVAARLGIGLRTVYAIRSGESWQEEGFTPPARQSHCLICGTSLEGKRAHAKHCSAYCRDRARQPRRRK